MTSKVGRRVDERDAFLQANTSIRSRVALSPTAIEDLRYFRKRFDDSGKKLSRGGLLKWMSDKHGIKVSAYVLHGLTKKAGVEPWWST